MPKALALIALLASATPAIAQQSSPQLATPRQVREFVAKFQSGVLKGCLANKPKATFATDSAYCNCYAQSFITRYRPSDLAAINQQATINPQSAYTINLMMQPEVRACAVSAQNSDK